MPESVQIRELFDPGARPGEIDERNLFLDEACPPAIRGELDRLLDSYGRLTTVAESERPTRAATLASGSPQHHPALTGPYRILREIAHGGMGTVYRAVRSDDAFRKPVALKLLRRGLTTDSFERRFRQERQILAGLQHPNIARCSTAARPRTASPTW